MSLKFAHTARRGDTLIEVMFAVGFFALVAIISVAAMNSGVNNAERDLELVTARNELNAQAEALRFIHSSYISEMTLPECSVAPAGEKCQQYKTLWETIITNAVTPDEARDNGLLNVADFGSCSAIYDVPTGIATSPLQNVKAFVLNTRKLTGSDVYQSYISINRPASLPAIPFRPTELSSRLIFHNGLSTSDDQLTDGTAGTGAVYSLFDKVQAVEGIWDFVVKDVSGVTGTGGIAEPKYYDFYIQTCWYGPRASNPTVLDTVIRLYNPEKI